MNQNTLFSLNKIEIVIATLADYQSFRKRGYQRLKDVIVNENLIFYFQVFILNHKLDTLGLWVLLPFGGKGHKENNLPMLTCALL